VANDFDRGSYRRRDYTGGHLNSTIASPTLKPPQKKSRLFLGIIVSVVSAVVLIASFALLQHKNSDPVPNNVKKSSTIPVYYPVKLPAGYSIKGNSFSNNVDVITYFAEDNKNNRIIFSIQKPLSKEEQKDFDKRWMHSIAQSFVMFAQPLYQKLLSCQLTTSQLMKFGM
jgi:hypothetical protein